MISFDYYIEIFHNDKTKLEKVKSLFLKELKCFEAILFSSQRPYDNDELWQAIHNIKPILYNLNCQYLLQLLNEYNNKENTEADYSILNYKVKLRLNKIYLHIESYEF
jgi:hypothetical protein